MRVLLLSVSLATLAGCSASKSDAPASPATSATSAAAGAAAPAAPKGLDFPGTEAGAKDLLKSFMKPDADHIALSKALRPRDTDYAKVFVGPAAEQAKAGYTAPWDAGAIVVKPKAGQTELLLSAATSAQLAAGGPEAKAFPGGYGKIAAHLAPDLTWYRFKFVPPGETLGMAFDGLVYVDGHWALFPKPWRVIK